VEGTETLLNARPDFAQRIKAVIHLDMVGGGPVTKTVFHVTRGPASLPSFVHDVAWEIASFVNEQSYAFAATGSAPLPFVAPTGGKEALLAQDSPHSMGSDHDVYQDSSFRIPAVYLNDWPDRYIHTNFDSAANIDPTKLLRAAFIAAATAIVLADEKADVAWTGSMPRTSGAAVSRGSRCEAAGCAVYRRKPSPKGPLAVFGYDYLTDHLKSAGQPLPKLLDWQPPRSTPFSLQPELATSEQYTYEILNFVDGTRNAQSIRDAVSAEYGPIPLDLVLDYLRALGAVGVIEPAH
jgi:aminopeptidase YwaD